MPWGLYKTRGDTGSYLTFQCESFTSIFSMFASRSLNEKSCSMEVFFSFIVVVCNSGMMFPGSFRLFVTWKYKSRKFYRNKVGRFSFHWSEVFSYEKKNQKKYWKKDTRRMITSIEWFFLFATVKVSMLVIMMWTRNSTFHVFFFVFNFWHGLTSLLEHH